jgi:GrpB-like predicted nucleotidyltransferase (UPF0157 family)
VTEREAELQSVRLQKVEVHGKPIELVEYDPAWPELYQREAEKIRAALGSRVRGLEHAGSTSVPGLAAKPIIDIVLAVADSADEDAYVPALEQVGYVLTIREPDWHQHRLLKGNDPTVNLHVFSHGSREVERMLAFRNRLRTNEAERMLYERTKRELAQRTWTYTQDYADAKTEIVEEILARQMRDRPVGPVVSGPSPGPLGDR